jgi:hypothetical protein
MLCHVVMVPDLSAMVADEVRVEVGVEVKGHQDDGVQAVPGSVFVLPAEPLYHTEEACRVPPSNVLNAAPR